MNDTLKNIRNIRLQSQHLVNKAFSDPKELIEWMGAVQAQDYNMAKWAIGCRLLTSTNKIIEEAFDRGDILRTHVMRPTWHFVSNDDIRWMVKLSSKKIISAWKSYDKKYQTDEKQYTRWLNQIEKLLEGNRHLTREEIKEEFERIGTIISPHEMNHCMMNAEALGIVCSGAVKNKKQTYALLDERVPKTRDFTKEEALFKLATKYFRSHSPASIDDFIWWSGLSTSDAKNAINLIKNNLLSEKYDSKELYIYDATAYKNSLDENLHLLPAFDEYIISYKDRTHVLPREHYHKAFNNYGTFYPILVYNGNVIGNWKKEEKKSKTIITSELFINYIIINNHLLEMNSNRYQDFMK